MDRPRQFWIPPDEITRHSGADIPQEMEFFVAPPAEIGTVLTADSSLRSSSKPMSARARLFWTLLITLAATLIVVFILGHLRLW